MTGGWTGRACRRRCAVVVAVSVSLAALTAGRSLVGHAAGMPVGSAGLSVFRPTQLPQICSSPQTRTLTATADTWVEQQLPSATHGGENTMRLISRATNRNARTLVRFELPAAPPGCTLTAATLRVNNTSATSGRTISVYRAAASWAESTASWSNQPAEAGTAVNAVAATGWMQWTVTTHVQAIYAGGNFGFVLRDAVENAADNQQQVLGAREGTTDPELILQWS